MKLTNIDKAFICAGLAMVVIVFMLVPRAVKRSEEVNRARAFCLQAGYPEMIVQDRTYFCTRKINGTDEVVQVRP